MAQNAVVPFQSDQSIIDLRKECETKLENLRMYRYSWWLHWYEIAEYILPRRYKWLITQNQFNRGSPINQKIIDTTVIKCARDLAAGMMGAMVSPARMWFELSLLQKDLADNQDVKVWLVECRKRMLTVMSASNFYTSVHVLLADLCIFGTASMLIYEDFENVIHCYNPCAGEYFLSNSYKFEVDTFYREFTMSVKECVQMFGRENCSPQVTSLYDSNQIDGEIIICHGIDPDPTNKIFKFREVYWEKGQGRDKILRKRGFKEQLFICPRWDLVGSDPYGRSPGMDALGDVKQLMVEQKRKAQAIDKMVNPPLMADVALKNQPASSLPGGITYIPSSGASIGMKPIYTVMPNLSDMKEDIAEIQQRIRELFFNDLFLMISQLEGAQPRTATEINERKSEKLLMLGPVVERLQDEFLDKAIERIFAMMMRAKLFPPAPPSIQGQEIAIEYVSMFSEAQKAVATTGMEQFIAMIGNLSANQPAVSDNINFDEYVNEYADMLGINPKILQDPKVIAQLRQQRAQAAQQQQQAQLAQAAVQGAQTLSQTNVGGGQNALQSMMGGV